MGREQPPGFLTHILAASVVASRKEKIAYSFAVIIVKNEAVYFRFMSSKVNEKKTKNEDSRTPSKSHSEAEDTIKVVAEAERLNK